jgi:hypothetical protein
MTNKGEIHIFKAYNGLSDIKVKLTNDTVWLNQKDMTSLF